MALNIDLQLSRQKIRQKFSVIKTNPSDDIKKNSSFWHFNSHFVLKKKIVRSNISTRIN